MRRPGRDAERQRCRPSTRRARRLMLDAQRTRALEEPIHRGAVERAGAARAIGLREPRQQLEIDFLREAAEGAVADLVAHLVPHAGLQVMRDDAEHLARARRSRRCCGCSADRETPSPARRRLPRVRASGCGRREGRRGRLAEVVAHRAEHDDRPARGDRGRRCAGRASSTTIACGSRRRLPGATPAPADSR